LLLTAFVAFSAAGAIAFVGIVNRGESEEALRRTALERAIPTVAVAPPALQ
jgi:hypothetical protein